jgi:hypothetical protein
MMDINTFLTTYQTFTTTPQLIKKLLQRYQVPEKSFASPEEAKQFMVNVVRPIQLRVIKLLKLLVDNNYREILTEEDLLNLIRSFVRGVVDQAALSKQIQTSVRYTLLHDCVEELLFLFFLIADECFVLAIGCGEETGGRDVCDVVSGVASKERWNDQGHLRLVNRGDSSPAHTTRVRNLLSNQAGRILRTSLGQREDASPRPAYSYANRSFQPDYALDYDRDSE